jgi:putative transposase
MQTVSRSQVVAAQDAVEEPLPPRIQEALGQLVGAAKEGLLALSVGVGLGVLEELMAEEVEDVCGPRGKHDAGRVAYRHGSDDGQVGHARRPPGPGRAAADAL